MADRCYVCEPRGCACSSPPPDVKKAWGAAEWLAMGDCWMHTSANDPARSSYGSAMDCYTRAVRLAEAAGDTVMQARAQEGCDAATRMAQTLQRAA